MSNARQFCTFRIAGELLGLPLEEVQEILRDQTVTPIPMAPPEVAGLINIRGDILAAIDLGHCLGRREAGTASGAAVIVIRTADGLISLVVDEIGDVLHLPTERLDDPPPNLTGATGKLLTGVFKLDAELLAVLDSQATVNHASAAVGYAGNTASLPPESAHKLH